MKNISVKNLTIAFEDKIILSDISFDVEEGDFICILGKNGSGKSTLAKSLNGLNTPTSGNVYIYGMDTNDENKIIDIRKVVGMAFQNPDNQIVASIVEEDIAFGLENIGVEPIEMRVRIDNAMKSLGIFDIKDELTNKLSGGQKQKVSIAGILAMKSKIIILDEPTSMLDRNARVDLLNLVKKLNVEENITVILISHNIEEIMYANRVIVLDKGKLVIDEEPQEMLLRNEELNNYGIELPYISRLATELKKRGFNYKGNEMSIDEII